MRKQYFVEKYGILWAVYLRQTIRAMAYFEVVETVDKFASKTDADAHAFNLNIQFKCFSPAPTIR